MKLKRSENAVSVLIPPTTRPADLAGMACKIEAMGFREVWTAEDYFELAGFSTAAIMLAATQQLRVGIGIVSAVVRHPAVTAMELSTLGHAFPGRLTGGIGHGVPFWTQQMGLYPKSPLTALRDCCTIVRRLLDGETVTDHDGYFYCDKIHVTHHSSDVPIMTGVIGPKSLELSGEVSDGVLASVMANPRYIRYAEKHLAAGAAKVGREELAFPVLAIYAADPDRDKALEVAGRIVAHYLLAAGPTPITGCLGWNDDVKALRELGDAEKIYQQMPREWVGTLAVAGTPDECAEKVNALLDAGASQVALSCAMGDRFDEQLEVASKRILPAVK